VEFGSLQVEPEQDGDLRPLFEGRPYTGTDMREGPGVDRVEDLRSLSYADGEVGTALCLDTLEHCEDPPQACRELARVVGQGGVAVVSSVMLFGIHAYPSDYFRFTPEGLRSMLRGFDDVWTFGFGDPGAPFLVVALAAKGRSLGVSLDDFPSLSGAQARYDGLDGVFRVGVVNYRSRELLRIVLPQLGRVAGQRARWHLSQRRRRATDRKAK
jgi:SAM-dependent methyltransferase